MEEARALCQRDDARFVPTGLTRGPWHPDAQHGGAPGALLALCAEEFDGGAEMAITRIAIDLLRPVPRTPSPPAPRPSRLSC